MSHEPHRQQDQQPSPATGDKPREADSLAALLRIEALLDEIRGRLETEARARQHQQFSPARLVGVLLQALAVGLIIVALADWVYVAPLGAQLVKLVFAGVLQLAALTAFVIAGKSS